MTRERRALLEVAELVEQIRADLLLLCLGLACIEGEVRDALANEAVSLDGLGGER